MDRSPGFVRPDWARRIVAMGSSVGDAAAMVSLEPDELIETARRATGLDDFGAATWEEPFRRLTSALVDEASLHVLGRLLTRHDLLRHLQTRLLIVRAVAEDPAISDEQVTAPVFITGPARSGTSILQEVLAQDPALRAPLGWEMAHPFPPPTGEPDERAATAECEFDLWSDIQPEFRTVHELAARLPEECLWLFAPEFESGFWVTCANIPSFLLWRAGTEREPGYRTHRAMLQVLQHGAPLRPWVLKSPVHVMQLEALFAVYPDARVIQTHRDPLRTVPSAISTVATGRWLRSDAVDLSQITASIAFGFTMMLNGIAAQRTAGRLPTAQIADLHYVDLLRDPIGAIAGVYETLDMAINDNSTARMRAYLDARPQDKHGTHRYSLADYGLDADTLRTQLEPYISTFQVEAESTL